MKACDMADPDSEADLSPAAAPDRNAAPPRVSPAPGRSVLLELALYALRATRTREELLDQAVRITAAALGGDLAKVLERVPPGAGDFLVTAGSGWVADDSVVGSLRIAGGPDASPSGRAEATGRVQGSSPAGREASGRLPETLTRAGVRSALDVAIPRAGEAEGDGHGVLQADSRRASAFGAADEALLQQIAGVLGAVLDAEDRHRVALEAATAVQALLRAEVEHRIANSLQGVAATLALEARLADANPQMAMPLRAAAVRVAAAGAVHRHLFRAEAAGAVQGAAGSMDAAALLHALCGDLSVMLSGPAGGGERRLTCVADTFPWPAARAGAIATIAAELAINAAKHAGVGTITLSLTAAEDGDAMLACEDEGPGFPADLDPTQSSGLGLRLIRTLAGPGADRVTLRHGGPGGRVRVRIARKAA